MRNFGFLLKDTCRLYVQRFERRAAALGLTLPQCKVLVYLARSEGISQAQLSEFAEIDPMALVRILDRMESDGWLERCSDPADRRARRLYLKPRSKPLLDDIWRLADATRGEAFAGISRQQAEDFIAVLEKIHGNIVSLDSLQLAASPVPPPKARGGAGPKAARIRRERSHPNP